MPRSRRIPTMGSTGTTYDRALSMLASGRYYQAEALVGCAIVAALRELVDVVCELAPAAADEAAPEDLPENWSRISLD